MKNEKVSLIVPYYNSSIYLLRKCLNSCLQQTYKNVEILVLIDGSPKDLTKLKNEYCSKYNNITFIESKNNHGVSFQRNRGIKMATGSYLQFIDADDFVDREMVEKMVSRLKEDVSDIAICGVADTVYDCEDGLYDVNTFFSFPSRFCHIQYTNFPTNKLFKLDIIKRYNLFFDEKIKLGEDAIFCQEYYKHVNYISCLHDRFYHYMLQSTSVTRKFDPDFYKYEERVIKAIDDNFKRKGLNEQEQEYNVHWLYRKAYLAYEHYYNAFENRDITKEELLGFYSNMINIEAFTVNPSGLKNNKYFEKEEYFIANNLRKDPKRIFRALSLSHGKRSAIKALFRK